MNRHLLFNLARLAPATFLAAMLCAPAPLAAGQVTLAWDPNAEPNLAGYRLRYGTSSGVHPNVIDVGNVTTSTVTGLQEGSTYWFVATAYNSSSLESDVSNEVSYTVPGGSPNVAPNISGVASQTIAEDAVMGPLAFTVSDVDHAATALTVTASSSNITLVPQASLLLGGSGSNRTVTATPAANATGSTTITLTVSDGSATATRSFTLTVTAVNDPPAITDINDQSTAIGAAVGPIPFALADVDNQVSALVVAASSGNTVLVPQASLVLGGTGASRTLTVTPAAGQSGTATITLSVSDGVVSVSDSFVLTVTGNLPPPWLAQDVGAPGLAGSASCQSPCFTVTGSGADIAGTTDQFHFACQPLSGDGEIIARVSSFQAASGLAKAGVMIRETLNGNSRNAFLCVTPGNGFRWQCRSNTGKSTASASGGALYAAPNNWVRIVRAGNMVRAYKSANGSSWTQVGSSVRLTMASQIQIGLAVTARNNLQTGVATFDSVTVVP